MSRKKIHLELTNFFQNKGEFLDLSHLTDLQYLKFCRFSFEQMAEGETFKLPSHGFEESNYNF